MVLNVANQSAAQMKAQKRKQKHASIHTWKDSNKDRGSLVTMRNMNFFVCVVGKLNETKQSVWAGVSPEIAVADRSRRCCLPCNAIQSFVDKHKTWLYQKNHPHWWSGRNTRIVVILAPCFHEKWVKKIVRFPTMGNDSVASAAVVISFVKVSG